MDKNEYPKPKPHLTVREIDAETVVLDRKQGLIHQFNKTAGFIWNQLDGKRNPGDLAKLLVDAFETDPEVAERDVVRFIFQLHELNLLESGI